MLSRVEELTLIRLWTQKAVKRSKAGDGKRQKPKDLAGRADEGHDAAVPLCSAAADANSRYPTNADLFAPERLGTPRLLRQLRRLMQHPPRAAIGSTIRLRARLLGD